MNKYFSIILFMFGLTQMTLGQERGDTHSGLLLEMAFTGRGMGIGVNYSFGQDHKNYLIGLDFKSIRDQHESPINPAFGRELGRKYVYGKLNYFHVLTPSFGINYNLIPKNSLNYANLRGMLKVGPAIGLLNPYYIEIFQSNQRPGVDSRQVEAFDPATHSYSRILGRGRILAEGFNPKFDIGVSVKALALLDFGPNQRYVHGISLGLMSDLFFKSVPIMAELDKLQNQWIFVVGSLGFIVGNRW